MIKVENVVAFGFQGALRGMRNPLNSWAKVDSEYDENWNIINLGTRDRDLLLRLSKAGTDHRKVLRMIHVQMDVTAPLYWWKDYDTYKVATTSNGCSTMHKIHSEVFTLDMFAHEHLDQAAKNLLILTIDSLNYYRQKYVDSGCRDKNAWYSMIQLLPSSFMQKRTLDLNYEVVLNIIGARSNHKLFEFREFCDELRTLPYIDIICDAIC